MSNANLFADYGLRVRYITCMQILAANRSAACESRASKFLVTNRTLSYSAEVSGTRIIWYQNAWYTSKVTGTSFWYQKLGRRTWVVCHGPSCLLMFSIETNHHRLSEPADSLGDGVHRRQCCEY